MSDHEGPFGFLKRMHIPFPGGGTPGPVGTNALGQPIRHSVDEAREASRTSGRVENAYDDDGNAAGSFWGGAKTSFFGK